MSRLPLGIITGTGVMKGWMATMAYSGFTGHTQHQVFGIHNQGIGRLDASYAKTATEVEHWARCQPAKVVLVGHSQGALHALRFGLEHPDLVDHVVLLCGPLDGTKMVSLIPGWFKPVMGVIMPAIIDMDWQSDYSRQLRQRAEQSWPEGVRVTMVSVHGDVYVRPRRSAYSLDLPVDQSRPFYVGWVRPRDLPAHVRHIRAPLAGHLTVLVHPAVRQIVRRRLSSAPPPAPVAA